ncbi:hypothetical protein Tco_0090706 [Tanacetum coccineum]
MMSFMQNSGNNGGSNHASTSGTLPSNTIPNPRNECKGITTRSGVVLDGPYIPPCLLPYVNPDSMKAKETEVPWKIDFPALDFVVVRLWEMSLRTDEERLIISVRSEELKYTTRPHKESVCMIDIFSSPKEKDEDPNAIFTSSEVVKCDFLTTNGDPITPPSTIPTKEDLTNEKVEKHEVKTCNLSKEISSICPSIKERLNFWKNKEVLEKNEILKRNNTCDFQTPSSSLEKKEVEGEKNLDVKTIVSFFGHLGELKLVWGKTPLFGNPVGERIGVNFDVTGGKCPELVLLTYLLWATAFTNPIALDFRNVKNKR